MTNKPIFVTEPYLPPLEEFIPYLEQIWASKTLTNNGQFHQRFEQALCEYLGVPFISLFANGTLALITALQAADLEGEVITTPFTFVATANAIRWNNLKPVFADIDPQTLNLDPNRIEEAISDKTTAILPVHCYGNPCDVEGIQAVADRHGLKVIYDAAHAFGVERYDGSLLRHGTMSTLSFHATKVFNTFEGGAVVCHDQETKQRLEQLKNFGLANETTVDECGYNGKMNEFSAALGLLQLAHIDSVIEDRAHVAARYRAGLADINGIRPMASTGHTKANYAYFPIMLDERYPLTRDELLQRLRDHNVIPRRYFYPLLPELGLYRQDGIELPVAANCAANVLCLPIFPGLDTRDVDRICDLMGNA